MSVHLVHLLIRQCAVHAFHVALESTPLLHAPLPVIQRVPGAPHVERGAMPSMLVVLQRMLDVPHAAHAELVTPPSMLATRHMTQCAHRAMRPSCRVEAL